MQSLFTQLHAPISVLIVNHGLYITPDIPLADLSLEQWEKTFSVNTTASFLVVREWLRALRAAGDDVKSKASVVFIGSTAGRFGEADHADYAASKSGEWFHRDLE